MVKTIFQFEIFENFLGNKFRAVILDSIRLQRRKYDKELTFSKIFTSGLTKLRLD